MALPVIIIDSATGSDSLASGAGPGDGTTSGSALTGTSASTDGAGTTVTLDSGTDLSNVLTTGAHVIYLADSTAGARNFGKITGKAGSGGSTPTVTVADAFGISLSGKSWAIGGKRASLMGTNSAKLIENNSGNGDAMPGWVMRMLSGHSETRSTTIQPRRAGDQTNGAITIEGIAGAATTPLLTFSNNGDAFIPRGAFWIFSNFELQNSNATKTASHAFDNVANNLRFNRILCKHATNYFLNFYYNSSSGQWLQFTSCNIQNCGGDGIVGATGLVNVLFSNNTIQKNGGYGISFSGAGAFATEFYGNSIAFNTSGGITIPYAGSTTYVSRISGNVFHGNGGDGLNFGATSANIGALIGLLLQNNRFTYNGGYGLNLSGSGITDAVLSGTLALIRNNTFYGNTSGAFFPTTLTYLQNTYTDDPSSGLASATKDYAGTTSGTNFMSSINKGNGWPGDSLPLGTIGSSYNYQDIGLQHQDSGGGSRVRRGGTIMKM